MRLSSWDVEVGFGSVCDLSATVVDVALAPTVRVYRRRDTR
jgi:hypothetical protein